MSTQRAAAEGYWSTSQVAVRTGLSYRQLDYLVRTNRLHPLRAADGSGIDRLWRAEDIAEVLAFVAMLQSGLRHEVAARLLADGQYAIVSYMSLWEAFPPEEIFQ